MSKVSTWIRILVDYIEEYKIIPLKYIDGNQVKENGKLSSCMTPKEMDSYSEPYVSIYNTQTDRFYDIAKENDPYGTECIMNLIKGRIEVPKCTEPIFYSVFCLLHEAGHYNDYMNDPMKYNADFTDDEMVEGTRKAAIAYRKRAIERRADQYALDRLNESIKNVDTRLFRGGLLV